MRDIEDFRRAGQMTSRRKPQFEAKTDRVPRGSSCDVGFHTANHDRIFWVEVTALHALALHAVDWVGIIHAGGLRLRALLMPVGTLVFSGGH